MAVFTIIVPDEYLPGLAVARALYNRLLPATVPYTDAQGVVTQVPNPALLATDADYMQQRYGVDAPKSWYESNFPAFHIPTGDWLQRWTMREKRAIRAVGAGNVAGIDSQTATQVQGFLDRLDAAPVISLSDPDVVQGVPMVCSLLERLGVIAAGQGAARAADINALNL